MSSLDEPQTSVELLREFLVGDKKAIAELKKLDGSYTPEPETLDLHKRAEACLRRHGILVPHCGE